MKLVLAVILTFIMQIEVVGQIETYTLSLTPFSTKKYDEFSPVYFKNGLVFCSNRRNAGILSYSTDENKGPIKIYFVDTAQGGNVKNTNRFSKELETNYNDGPVSFNKDGNQVYYSRNLETGTKLSDASGSRNKLGIFSSVLIDGKWSKILDFRFNNEYYNITTPCLSPDGNRLYFASDKPGGYGGFDLYYCQRKNDYWAEPVNLGPIINTKGNELYPFVNELGQLFFSSDGLPGKGGKDIFFSKYADSAWRPPIPLDPPINSKYDDFALITDNNLNEGYFSSNRGGSMDIYHFKKNFPQILYCEKQVENQYYYYFKDDGAIKINSSYLGIEWEFGDGTKAFESTAEHYFPGPGKYSIKQNIVDKKTGKVIFIKLAVDLDIKESEQPYIESQEQVVSGELIEFNGQKSHFNEYQILGYSWDFGDGSRDVGNLVSHSFKGKEESFVRLIVSLKNLSTGKISEACVSKRISIFKDAKEKTSYLEKLHKINSKEVNIKDDNNSSQAIRYSAEKELQQDAVFQLEVISSKKKISLSNAAFKKIPNKYLLKEVFNRSDSTYSYIVDEETSLMALYPAYLEMISLGYQNVICKTYILKNAAEKELYNLKKIFGVFSDAFFEENEYTASPGAYPILDQVVEIMNNHPEIRLEIAAYADDEGSSEYNMELSQKRAQTMANYLINKGIHKDRLIAKGFGKSKPISPSHSEEDRKINRRVQFIIVNE